MARLGDAGAGRGRMWPSGPAQTQGGEKTASGCWTSLPSGQTVSVTRLMCRDRVGSGLLRALPEPAAV